MKIQSDKIELVSVKSLINHPKNNNKHSTEQIERLTKLIEYQGFRNPLVVQKGTNLIVAGHGRLEAAKKLGMKEVPVTYQEFDSEAQLYAYLTSDNAIHSWSELDLSMVNSEMLDFGPDFDIDMLGIKDFVIEPIEKFEAQSDEDDVPEVVHPITRKGDLWLLGNHRLLCGDSTMINDVERLMNGDKADLLHTDPPYNVAYSNADRPKAGKVDLGYIKNDKMEDSEFLEFLFSCLSNAYTCLKNDSSAYIWYASRESVNFLKATGEAGFEVNQQIIWKKPMLLGRGRYQWAHEPCIFAVKGRPFFTDDRTKTTVWDFGGYDKSKNIHPTQKPVFLPEEAINNSSKQGSIVLDLFNGSGSTLIGCEKTSRSYRGMEIDEKFVDATVKRWEQYTGKKATLESTGQTYEELKAERDGQS